MTNGNENANFVDLLFIWMGTVLGHFTLSDAVLWLTLIYTAFRIYILIKQEFFKKD